MAGRGASPMRSLRGTAGSRDATPTPPGSHKVPQMSLDFTRARLCRSHYSPKPTTERPGRRRRDATPHHTCHPREAGAQPTWCAWKRPQLQHLRTRQR